jgi:hypothetical protein
MVGVERRTLRRETVFESGTILEVHAGADTERDSLQDAGHHVITCPGPTAGGGCPLVERGACAMVDAADGVVFRLDLDDPYHREMLRCYRSELGDATPLHVVVREGQQERFADDLAGLPVSVGSLASGLPGFSAQVGMAAAARSMLSELADPSRRSSRPARARPYSARQ